MSKKLREYATEHFYDLCQKNDRDNDFIFDIICLNCKMRVGAHGYEEFANCAVEYLGR